MKDHARFRWLAIDAGRVRDWVRLGDATEAADHQDEFLGEQDLLDELSDPDIDYARGSAAIYDGDEMIGWAVLQLRTADEPVHAMRLGGAVHPRWRGLGVGSAILRWAERAAIPLHEERFPGAPLSRNGICLARNEDAVELFAAHGYEQTRRFLRMTVDLTAGIPDLVVPPGVDIVGYTPERSADARRVHDEAFRDHWGSTDSSQENWDHFVGFSAFRPGYSFLAYEAGEPVGVILGHDYESYTRATGRRDLYIPTVGTLKEARKRGIASALLATTLHAIGADGFAAATLDVDADSPTGAVRLYERAGFAVSAISITHTKRLLA